MNDSIPALGQLIEPPPVSFTVETPGWYVVGSIVLILLLLITILIWLNYRKNRYRRTALRLLQKKEEQLLPDKQYKALVYEANMLIKRVGMQRYGRENMASLRGKDWIDFLNRTASKMIFNESDEELITIVYSEEKTLNEQQAGDFVSKAKHWIKKHKYVFNHNK